MTVPTQSVKKRYVFLFCYGFLTLCGGTVDSGFTRENEEREVDDAILCASLIWRRQALLLQLACHPLSRYRFIRNVCVKETDEAITAQTLNKT